MTSRRELAVAVLGAAAGAGLALYAATRTWAERVTPRPAPLPAVRETYTGAELASWLPAVALVALAAGIALLATRGLGRQLVAVASVGCGLALAAGGGYGIATAGAAGRTAVAGGVLPGLCAVGGLLVAAIGVFTLLRSRGWPAMGSRYERASAPGGPKPDPEEPAQLWDALDSGADPTDRG